MSVNRKFTEKFSGISPWVLIYLIIVIIIGGILRFVNLDQKYYWRDEAYTSFTAAGLSSQDINMSAFYNTDWLPDEIITEYQRIRADRNAIDIYHNLGKENALNPPLYFILTHYWVQFVGHNPGSVRALTAIFSLLILPGVYFFVREMGWSQLTALLSTALFAVSPFQIQYAQEARFYSLFMLFVVLASAILLQALRSKKKWYWLLYAAIMIASAYTNAFTGFLLIGHGLYVLLIYGLRRNFPYLQFSIQIRWFILTSLTIIFAYFPWVLNVFGSRDSTDWIFNRISIFQMIKLWLRNFSSPFVDLHQLPGIVELAIIISILFLSLYSMIYMLLNASRGSSTFVILLILVNVGILLLIDFIIGAVGSTQSRFVAITLLAIKLAVAFLLASKITSRTSRRRNSWSVILVVLIGVALLSSTIIVMSPTVRGKGNDKAFIDSIRILNDQEAPVLLVDQIDNNYIFGNILGMSHKLDPDVRLRFVRSVNGQLSIDSQDLFWLHVPNNKLIDQIPKKLTNEEFEITELVPNLLWRLKIAE